MSDVAIYTQHSSSVAHDFLKCWMMDEKASIEMACEILRFERESEAMADAKAREENPEITTAVATIKAKTKRQPPKRPVLAPRACVVCGNVFNPYSENHVSCSRRCCDLARQARLRAISPKKLSNTQHRKGVMLGVDPFPCPICGVSVTPIRLQQKYCSRKCKRAGQKENDINKMGQVRVCVECKQEFTLVDVNRLYHCSPQCFRDYKNRLIKEAKMRKKELEGQLT